MNQKQNRKPLFSVDRDNYRKNRIPFLIVAMITGLVLIALEKLRIIH